MRILKQLLPVTLCIALGMVAGGCGSSKEVDFEAVTFEQLSPEDQERIRKMHEEANAAIRAGQPIPPDLITEEMLTSGMLQDGVLLTPEQQQQMRQQNQ